MNINTFLLLSMFISTAFACPADYAICPQGGNQHEPAISGVIVVWDDHRNGNADIYGYNLSTQTEFPICIHSNDQYTPAISDNIVVWYDNRNGNEDIYGYNLSTQMEFPICVNESNQQQVAISGNIVVWQDDRNGNEDIYGYDITTQTEFPICTETNIQTYPDISGDIVVWSDTRDSSGNIYGYNLSTQTEFFICRPNGQTNLAISENIVVWQSGTSAIYGYDLLTENQFPICTKLGSRMSPAISGNIVVWQDYRNDNYDIYAFNLTTEKEYPVCTQYTNQWSVAISGDTVVWEDYRNGINNSNSDIYGLSIDWERVVVSSDMCASAFEVFEDVPYYGATYLTSGTDISSCSFNDIYDAWNSYRPTQGGTVTISTDGSNFDTVLSVYEACGGNELACNDDYSIDNTQSKIVMDVVKGKNYLIRIAGVNEHVGDYNLLVTRGECANKPLSDVNGDCKVNIIDFALLASEWMFCGYDNEEACWE